MRDVSHTCVPWRLEGVRVNPSQGRWLFPSLLWPMEHQNSSLPQSLAGRAKGNPPCGASGRAEPCQARTGLFGCWSTARKNIKCAAPESPISASPSAAEVWCSTSHMLPPRTPHPYPLPLCFFISLCQQDSPTFSMVPGTGAGPPTRPKCWEGAVLFQPGKRCLGEALHAGRGHHAIERLKEGTDDDAELTGAEKLRTSLAKTRCGQHPSPGTRTKLPAQPWIRCAGCLPPCRSHWA